MEERLETLLRWLNRSFHVFKNSKLTNLTDLKDPFLLQKILYEMDEQFFSLMELSVIKSETSTLYNLNMIYKYVKKYYLERFDIEVEHEFFSAKEALNSEDHFEMLPLVELLTGISAKCNNSNFYVEIMKTMLDQDSQILFEILNERLSNKRLTENEISRLKTEYEEEIGLLSMKIDNLTSNNSLLREENKTLSQKNDDLTKNCYIQELNLKELENKNNELLMSIERHYSESQDKHEDETVLISMQLSELKGKLEAKEKNLIKFREEHDRMMNENNNRIFHLQQENESLKDKSLKYDILKDKYERAKADDNSALKHKLLRYEKNVKDLEEKLKFYKNFNEEKTKLLNKIEELHIIIEENKEISVRNQKENNFLKTKIYALDSENLKLKKEIEHLYIEMNGQDSARMKSEHDSEENITERNNKESLLELEDNSNLQKTILELEMKVKFLEDEKSKLVMKIESLEKSLSSKSEDLDRYKELRLENENIKLTKEIELSEIENKYNKNILQMTHKHNEDILVYKEKIIQIEHEKEFLKKELSKNEELMNSKQMLIEEINKKESGNKQSSTKLLEYEVQIKELTHKENIELKNKLREKEEMIQKYEKNYKEIIDQIKVLEEKSNNFSVDELVRKDNIIRTYQQKLDENEKKFQEEVQLVTSALYEIAYNYIVRDAKKEE